MYARDWSILMKKLLTVDGAIHTMNDRLEGFPPKNSCGP
jgi:hypothetical protein